MIANTIALPDLALLVDSLEEGILFLDKDRRIVTINKSARNMFGLSENQQADKSIIGQLCQNMLPGVPCAIDCNRDKRCSLVPQGSKKERVEEVAFEDPDGKTLVLNLRAIALSESSTVARCAVVLTNLTHERQLEEQVSQRMRMGGLIGRSPPMQQLFQYILKAAASDASVLIQGESGTGKELVATALHENSNRSKGPYIRVHCAALPENLLESELFGHVRGAYTGATTARAGRFEAAHTGTLLLDEIGEVPLHIQVKLLRVLQEREVERLGENTPRKVDVRIIAATNKDLAQMVEEGTFREDLYYRLRVVPMHTPTLRSRREDIPLLVNHLLSEIQSRYGQTFTMTEEAMQLLEKYDWPGNIRELANVLELSVIQADGPNILPSHFPLEIQHQSSHELQRANQLHAAAALGMGDSHNTPSGCYRSRIKPDEEKKLILATLREVDGNKTSAARKLGMSRTTLWKKLKRFAIV
jgi:transcriptional regulator with PAS, ATPase and Fis domain